MPVVGFSPFGACVTGRRTHMLVTFPGVFGNQPGLWASILLMNSFSDMLSALLRVLLRAVLFLAGLVFVLSFLAAAIVVVLGVSLWSLVTGRKPAPVVLFTQMRERSRRYAAGAWPAGSPGGRTGAAGDVVDVEASEVRAGGSSRPLTPLDPASH